MPSMLKTPSDRSLSTPIAGAKILHPGDVVMAQQGESMETLLGSCVSIVLTDPRRSWGVMCHIVHSSESPRTQATDTRFAWPAWQAMDRLLLSRGLRSAYCHGFLYGGGHMFPDHGDADHSTHVGAQNVRVALDMLRRAGIALLDQHTGGHLYRKIQWTVGAQFPVCIPVPVITNR